MAGDGGGGVRCELRHGRWETVLADVGMVDALISDPPYSERTHAGMRVGKYEVDARSIARNGVTYTSWTPADAERFVRAWSPRVRGWMVVITDHVLAPVIQATAEACGRYAFAPLPFVELGKQPRLTGDGPASWTCWIAVSRPSTRAYSTWGSLAGAYVPPSSAGGTANRDRYIKGGKPEWLMRALVRDYTRASDVIVDPCAGGATTLIAARAEGRHSIGAEMDPKTYALAMKRIGRPWTPNLFGDCG